MHPDRDRISAALAYAWARAHADAGEGVDITALVRTQRADHFRAEALAIAEVLDLLDAAGRPEAYGVYLQLVDTARRFGQVRPGELVGFARTAVDVTA